jgi:hypothetical protein
MTKEIEELIAKHVPKGIKVREYTTRCRFYGKKWSGVCVTYGEEDIAWRLNGKVHRVGSPAVFSLDGTVEWTVSDIDTGYDTDTNEYWKKCYEFCKGTDLEQFCMSKILGAKE